MCDSHLCMFRMCATRSAACLSKALVSPVSSPRDLLDVPLEVMDKVKKHKGCPEAHTAHQMSWDAMMTKVVGFVQEGDVEGLRKFVEDFTAKSNTLLEQLKGWARTQRAVLASRR